MRYRSRRRHAPPGPNMTPMVDVVLVILIFFMAAMGIAVRERYLSVGAPPVRDAKASAARAERKDATPASDLTSRAVLRLRREENRTVVSGLGMEGVGLAEVGARLQDFKRAGAADNLIVVVVPTGDVPYQDVVIAHDACAAAGIAGARLGVIGE